MPTPAEKFTGNPVKFMEKNIIIVRYGGMKAGRVEFTLKLADRASAKKWWGPKVPVYDLLESGGGGGADTFEAYWLPYDNNAKYQAKLGHHADIMFTPTMDGCTFAVGGRNARGRVAVAHLNYQTDVDDPKYPGSTKKVIDQDKIDDEITAIYDDDSPYILRKGDYKSKEGHQITTYGVRGGRGWSFYYQKRRKTGMKLVDVKEQVMFMDQLWDKTTQVGVDQFEFIGNFVGIKNV